MRDGLIVVTAGLGDLMDRWTDRWPRLAGALIVVVAGGVAGCSVGKISGNDTAEGPAADTGVAPDSTEDSGGEPMPDGGDEPDSGQPDSGNGGPSGPFIQTFTSCGGGGVSTGDGLRAIQCYGPSEAAGREASGDGVRWRPGGFRIVTD